MNSMTVALNAGSDFSEKGSTDTKLSPPSSSAAMLSTVTHCWTMSFRMLPAAPCLGESLFSVRVSVVLSAVRGRPSGTLTFVALLDEFLDRTGQGRVEVDQFGPGR